MKAVFKVVFNSNLLIKKTSDEILLYILNACPFYVFL